MGQTEGATSIDREKQVVTKIATRTWRGIDPALRKYLSTQDGLLREVMLAASTCGHWYTTQELANITELTTRQIGRAMIVIREGSYRIHKRERGDRFHYEYLIERLS